MGALHKNFLLKIKKTLDCVAATRFMMVPVKKTNSRLTCRIIPQGRIFGALPGKMMENMEVTHYEIWMQ